VVHHCQNSIETFILLTAADQGGGNVATDIVRGGNWIYLVPYRLSSLQAQFLTGSVPYRLSSLQAQFLTGSVPYLFEKYSEVSES